MFKDFKSYSIVFVIAILFLVAIYFIFNKINGKELPSNLIANSGRIDGDLILLSTKYPARIEKIFVQDGDQVSTNQLIVKLTSKELLSKIKAIEELIKATKKEKLSFGQMIEASKMELELLKNTLPHLVNIKEENLKILNKSLKSIKLKIESFSLQCSQNKKEYERYKRLYNSNTISPEKFELSELKYKTTKKEFDSLKIEKNKLLNNIENGKSVLKIEKNNLNKIEITQQKILASQTKLSAVDDKINQLLANKDEIGAMIDELSLKSPVDGYVAQKISNIGEVAGGGMPIVTLIDPDSFYLKLFVDTIENGNIKIGDRAVIFLDSNRDNAIDAKVVRIEQKAEFTPKDVNVRSDRIQRMFAIHLKPLKVIKVLKLGLPAIGIIAIDKAVLPKSLDDIPEI